MNEHDFHPDTPQNEPEFEEPHASADQPIGSPMDSVTASQMLYSLQKPAAPLERRDTVFFICAAICSVLCVDLGMFGGFALGVTLTYPLILLLTVVYLSRSGAALRPFPLFCGAASLAGSVIFTLCNDQLTNTLWYIAIVVLYGIFLAGTYGGRLRTDWRLPFDALHEVLILPFDRIAEPFRSVKYRSRETERRGPGFGQICIGLLISLPVLLIVLPLLTSSDYAFEKLLSALTKNFAWRIFKLIVGLLLAPLLISLLFTHRKGLRRQPVPNPFYTPAPQNGYLSSAAATTLLSVLSFFYAAYLFSQLAYFFSAFSGILPEGYAFSPAEYARRGFFELCAVCAINLGVIFLLTLLVRRQPTRRVPLSVRCLAGAVCGFSLIFAAIALSKMALYIGDFGLTRLRLLTSVFILIIALTLIAVILRLISPRVPYMKIVVVGCCIVGLAIGFADIDRTVAQYNLTQYRSGALEEIDAAHLGTLSDSAVPVLIELLDDGNPDVRKQAADALYSRRWRYYESIECPGGPTLKQRGFSSYNLAYSRAQQLVNENWLKIIKLQTTVNYDS